MRRQMIPRLAVQDAVCWTALKILVSCPLLDWLGQMLVSAVSFSGEIRDAR